MSDSSGDDKSKAESGSIWGISQLAISGIGSLAFGVADMAVNTVSAVGTGIGLTNAGSDTGGGAGDDSDEDSDSEMEDENIENEDGEGTGFEKSFASASTSVPSPESTSTSKKVSSKRLSKKGSKKRGSKKKSNACAEMDIDIIDKLPIAGTSMQTRRCEKSDIVSSKESGDPSNSNPFCNTWATCEAEQFQLRVGPNYKKFGKKASSGPQLYETVGLDVISSSERIVNIGSHVKLPEEWTNVETNHPLVPPVFISVCQLPEVGPNLLSGVSSFFVDKSEGPGKSVVSYFRIKPETAEAIKNLSTASPAIKLFVDFCVNAADKNNADSYYTNPKSTYAGRFKVIPLLDNIDDLGLPGFVAMYNAKPALIAKCGTPYRGSNYLCFDSNVHAFGGPARTAMQVMTFDTMHINMGFCIESREDEELPEVMLGCIYLHEVNIEKGVNWEATLRSAELAHEYGKTPITAATQAELDLL